MKDEEYLFREDVREKAITARSAHKRPRRSGCRMPQYTAKELREMNGPTYTVNLGKPIAYKEFKALSESLQKEYLKDIFAKYNVGMSAVAELLGVPVSTCTSKLHKLGFTFPRGFKPSKEDLERFRADFGLADAPAKKNSPAQYLYRLFRRLRFAPYRAAVEELRPGRRGVPNHGGSRSSTSRGINYRACCFEKARHGKAFGHLVVEVVRKT